MSFFGGNPNLSHFSVTLRHQRPGELLSKAKDRQKKEREKLKAAGLKPQTYFQYRNKDEAGKADAKARADTLAARIKLRTGIAMDVCEGFFL